jgi:predicted phosphodiesterase
MFKRMAVLSDIHGNLPALEAVLADVQKRNVDGILNLGDLISGPLWPHETIQFLMRQNWIQIAGNHDRKLVHQPPQEQGPSDHYAYQFLSQDELNWLGSLPASRSLENGCLLFHGAPASDTTYLLETIDNGRTHLANVAEISPRLAETKAPVLLCGHTHQPRLVLMPDNTLIINPGSVGLPAYSDDTPVPHITETGSPHARYAIVDDHAGQWTVDLISVPYDHQQAAAQAHKNNRPDWEIALRSGFMH